MSINQISLYVSFQERDFSFRHNFQVLGSSREQYRFTCFYADAVAFVVSNGAGSLHADVNNKRIQFAIVHVHGFCQVVNRSSEVRTAYQFHRFVFTRFIVRTIIIRYSIVDGIF